MYKCLKCKAIFDNVATRDGGVSYFPRPFGYGYEPFKEHDVECCPCCESEDFKELEWDGEHCPFCNKELDTSKVKDDENFSMICSNCNYEVEVIKGLLSE